MADGRRQMILCKTLSLVGIALMVSMPPAEARKRAKRPIARQPAAQQPAQPQQSGQYPGYQYPGYQYPNAPAQQYPPYRYPTYQYPAAKEPHYYPGAQAQVSYADQQACIGDVFNLCNQFVPDVPGIIACLQSNKPKLSPACRAVFARGKPGGGRQGRAGRAQ